MVLFTMLSYAQQPLGGHVYRLISSEHQTECNIHFLNYGEYYMSISHLESQDIVAEFVLSYGKYVAYNDSIMLKDEVFGYDIELVAKDNVLEVFHAFAFMQGKRFVLYGETDETSAPVKEQVKLKKKKDLEDNNKQHQGSLALNYGLYTSSCTDYRLVLSADKKYKLEYQDCIVSEGEWRQNHNELQLKDLFLSHTFYILISENELVGDLLPGFYPQPCVFKKIEGDTTIAPVLSPAKKGFGCSRKK